MGRLDADRDRVGREQGRADGVLTEEQKMEERELADGASWFRYTV